MKTRADVHPGEYAAEAAGLRWLAEPGALRTPTVLGWPTTLLVLDWVDEGRAATRRVRRGPRGEVHAGGRRGLGRDALGRADQGGALELPRTSPVRTGRRSTPRPAQPRPPAGRAVGTREPGRRVGPRPHRSTSPDHRDARATPRRPVERQRPLGPARPRLADRPGGARWPSARSTSRGSSCSATPDRRSSRPTRTACTRSHRGGETASGSTAVPAARSRCVSVRWLSRSGRADFGETQTAQPHQSATPGCPRPVQVPGPDRLAPLSPLASTAAWRRRCSVGRRNDRLRRPGN